MSKLDDIVDAFELLGDWEQRYQYLVELGEQLPDLPAQLHNEDNRVKACMSKVWVVADERDGHIQFRGDCDTPVIKGVLALLISLCNGMGLAQIQAVDMDEIFSRLKLDEHLSPNRHVGVYAMFELMKQKAQKCASSSHAA